MAVIRTVLGDVSPDKIGIVLPHEHVFFHWPGAEHHHEATYDSDHVAGEIAAELDTARQAHGLSCVVDLSTSDAGRNVELLAEVSRRSGVQIVGATGLYTESMGIPYYWRVRPLDALEEYFAREIAEGVLGADIRCGIIKVASGPELGGPSNWNAVQGSGLGNQEKRVFTAAARVQRRLGVAITTHTDPADWALGNIGAEQLDILQEAGADLTRCVIGHADGTSNIEHLTEILRRGASVGLDTLGYQTFGFPSDDLRLALVVTLVAMGYSSQLMLSYDRTFFEMRPRPSEGDPFLYNKQGLEMLFENFIPRLLASGVSEEAIHQMMVENPRRILAF